MECRDKECCVGEAVRDIANPDILTLHADEATLMFDAHHISPRGQSEAFDEDESSRVTDQASGDDYFLLACVSGSWRWMVRMLVRVEVLVKEAEGSQEGYGWGQAADREDGGVCCLQPSGLLSDFWRSAEWHRGTKKHGAYESVSLSHREVCQPDLDGCLRQVVVVVVRRSFRSSSSRQALLIAPSVLPSRSLSFGLCPSLPISLFPDITCHNCLIPFPVPSHSGRTRTNSHTVAHSPDPWPWPGIESPIDSETTRPITLSLTSIVTTPTCLHLLFTTHPSLSLFLILSSCRDRLAPACTTATITTACLTVRLLKSPRPRIVTVGRPSNRPSSLVRFPQSSPHSRTTHVLLPHLSLSPPPQIHTRFPLVPHPAPKHRPVRDDRGRLNLAVVTDDWPVPAWRWATATDRGEVLPVSPVIRKGETCRR